MPRHPGTLLADVRHDLHLILCCGLVLLGNLFEEAVERSPDALHLLHLGEEAVDGDEVISARRPIDGEEGDGPNHDPFFSLCLDSSTIRWWSADVGAAHSTIIPLDLGLCGDGHVADVVAPGWPAAFHRGRRGSRSQRIGSKNRVWEAWKWRIQWRIQAALDFDD